MNKEDKNLEKRWEVSSLRTNGFLPQAMFQRGSDRIRNSMLATGSRGNISGLPASVLPAITSGQAPARKKKPG